MSSQLVVNHQHCVICNRAMTYDADEKWCSDECKAQLTEHNKRRRNMMYLLYGLAAFTLVIAVLGSLRL